MKSSHERQAALKQGLSDSEQREAGELAELNSHIAAVLQARNARDAKLRNDAREVNERIDAASLAAARKAFEPILARFAEEPSRNDARAMLAAWRDAAAHHERFTGRPLPLRLLSCLMIAVRHPDCAGFSPPHLWLATPPYDIPTREGAVARALAAGDVASFKSSLEALDGAIESMPPAALGFDEQGSDRAGRWTLMLASSDRERLVAFDSEVKARADARQQARRALEPIPAGYRRGI